MDGLHNVSLVLCLAVEPADTKAVTINSMEHIQTQHTSQMSLSRNPEESVLQQILLPVVCNRTRGLSPLTAVHVMKILGDLWSISWETKTRKKSNCTKCSRSSLKFNITRLSIHCQVAFSNEENSLPVEKVIKELEKQTAQMLRPLAENWSLVPKFHGQEAHIYL